MWTLTAAGAALSATPTPPLTVTGTTVVSVLWFALPALVAGLALIAAEALSLYKTHEAARLLAEAEKVEAATELARADAEKIREEARLASFKAQSGAGFSFRLLQTTPDDPSDPSGDDGEKEKDAVDAKAAAALAALERAFNRHPHLVAGLVLLLVPLVLVSGYGISIVP